MCLSRPPRDTSQRTIDEWVHAPGSCLHANIDPAGDPLLPRKENDGITRVAYHNIATSTMGHGFEVANEIDVINKLGVNIQGFSEINKPWSSQNKWEYDFQMDLVFNHSRTIYSSLPTDYETTRQQGGNLLTVNGSTADRVRNSGSDKLGRFCWFTPR